MLLPMAEFYCKIKNVYISEHYDIIDCKKLTLSHYDIRVLETYIVTSCYRSPTLRTVLV